MCRLVRGHVTVLLLLPALLGIPAKFYKSDVPEIPVPDFARFRTGIQVATRRRSLQVRVFALRRGDGHGQ